MCSHHLLYSVAQQTLRNENALYMSGASRRNADLVGGVQVAILDFNWVTPESLFAEVEEQRSRLFWFFLSILKRTLFVDTFWLHIRRRSCTSPPQQEKQAEAAPISPIAAAAHAAACAALGKQLTSTSSGKLGELFCKRGSPKRCTIFKCFAANSGPEKPEFAGQLEAQFHSAFEFPRRRIVRCNALKKHAYASVTSRVDNILSF